MTKDTIILIIMFILTLGLGLLMDYASPKSRPQPNFNLTYPEVIE